MAKSLFDLNCDKIRELEPSVHYAALAWLSRCWELNFLFRIEETYRTQERQNFLYTLGRRGIAGEEKRTWTLHSLHTQRLAMDCYPIRCTHDDLTTVAAAFFITHPFPEKDPPHYQMDSVPPRRATPNPKERLRQLERRIRVEKDPDIVLMLLKEIERLKVRISHL